MEQARKINWRTVGLGGATTAAVAGIALLGVGGANAVIQMQRDRSFYQFDASKASCSQIATVVKEAKRRSGKDASYAQALGEVYKAKCVLPDPEEKAMPLHSIGDSNITQLLRQASFRRAL